MDNTRSDFILIASADDNWGIGSENRLLKRIPEDMKRFSAFTRDNLIIVGRKTLASFKDGKPLADRVNVVMSRDRGFACDGAVVVNNLAELMDEVVHYPKNIYVCGGEMVYKELLPFCERALITRIEGSFPADAHLPNLDKDMNWIVMDRGPWLESKTGVRYRFVEYRRKPQFDRQKIYPRLS